MLVALVTTGSAPVSSRDTLLLKLAQLKTQASRESFLRRHAPLIHRDVIPLLAQIVVETIRKDTRKALQLAEAGVLIARRLRNRECAATAWRAKANALYGVGDNGGAVRFHRRAIALFLTLGKRKEAARALSGSIQPHILLGEYDEAFSASEQARALYVELGEDWRLARLEINTGNIFHRQDRFEEALSCYERAYQGLLNRQDAEGLAIVLGNLAVCLVSLNDFGRALQTFERARSVCEQNGMPILVAQSDYNIAYLYYLRGDYSQAIDGLYASRRAFQTIGDPYHIALCQLDLSEIYLEINLNEDAEVMARESFFQFRKLKTGYEAAKSLVNQAIALGRQEKAQEALKLFKIASKRFQKENNRVWPRMIELYQAVVLCREGRYAEARRFCAGAARFFDGAKMPGKAALAHLILARIALHEREFTVAATHTDHALKSLQGIEASEIGCQAYFLRGRIAEEAGDTSAAQSAYLEAQRRLESLRSRLNSEELKIAFMKNRLEVYERLVALCLFTESSKAFGYIEAAKSRSMAEVVAQGGVQIDFVGEGDLSIVKRLNQIRQDLNWYYHRIEIGQLAAEAMSPAETDRLRKKANELEREYSRAHREMPRASRDRAMDTSGDSLKEIQQNLGRDCTLVEYFRVEDQLVAAVVTAQNLRLVRVTQVSSVREPLQQLQFQLGKVRYSQGPGLSVDALLPPIQSSLSRLHECLMAPLQPHLTTEHLVIAPHGLLHYLPFHALRVDDEYLCDRMSVSYAPSATVFSQSQRMHANPIQSSLILGIPDQAAPLIEDEVKSLAEILPNAKMYLGDGASAGVLRNEGPESDLIHISTHGTFRQDNPMFSSIRLGDGALNLHDLYRMRFDSTLVTLSGCSTGMNVVVPGDELLGLQRGLLYAGARSMLLSLWDVSDQTSAELMSVFYREVIERKPLAAALRGAMREIRSRYPHPYYWAPFILIGKHGNGDQTPSGTRS
jgi:CHAT domain-containing protein/predicted negative regulator of RcsB-dependent stress response